MTRYFLFFVLLGVCPAEVRRMTLQQAIDLALKQNPDLALARLDERKAQENIRVAKDPFSPRIGIGSGLAYNNGFPLSIEGSAPAVFRAQASQYLFNRQQTYTVAKVKENARGAGIASASKQDEVVYTVAARFLDAERASKEIAIARRQVESLEKIAQATEARVQEGRDLAVESKRTLFNLARARQRAGVLEGDLLDAQLSLAAALGFEDGDRVEPLEDARQGAQLPPTEEAAVEQALASSKELRKIESDLLAEGLDIKAQKAARLPRVDLVAQYGLFAKFNNYDDFFNTFVRNNGLIGVSFQIPVLVGPAVSALSAQAEINASRLRVQRTSARQQIALDTRKSFRDVAQARSAGEVAKLDLDLAREQVSVLLALMEEGRATLRQVEEGRFAENERWIAFHESQYTVERAGLHLLRQTGSLASLR